MMPTVLNVNEAKANFSSVLAEVERKARSLSPIPGLAGKIKINCDLFADGSGDWEACNAPATP